MATEYKKLLMRSGLSSQLVKSKLLPGEFAVTTDDKKLYICLTSGHTEQVATVEQLANILDVSSSAYTAMLTLLNTLDDNPSQLTSILNAISTLTDGLTTANSNIATNANDISTIEDSIADMKDGTKDGSLQKQINTLNNNLAYTAPVTVDTSALITNNAMYYKKNGVVCISIFGGNVVNQLAAWGKLELFTLPEGCRPATTLYFPCNSDNNAYSIILQIELNGKVSLYNRNSSAINNGSSFMASCSFPV